MSLHEIHVEALAAIARLNTASKGVRPSCHVVVVVGFEE